jgi:hypothetical protein
MSYNSNNNNNNIMSQDRFNDTQQQKFWILSQGLNPIPAAMLRASQGQGSGIGTNTMSTMLPNNGMEAVQQQAEHL